MDTPTHPNNEAFLLYQRMVDEDRRVRPICRVHGVPMEDGDSEEGFFCVMCADEPHVPTQEVVF